MANAIILTYAGISKEEQKLLKNTNVFKVACNNYCAELKPNVRITLDDIVQKCIECDTCPVISVNHSLDRKDIINGSWLPHRHSSLISCLDYLYLEGYTNVLLIATNPKGTPTYHHNLDGVNFIKRFLNIYKYSSEGTFNVPVMTIKEFLMLTDEEKLLGIKEQRQQTMYKETIFTEFCLFEVHTEGKDNKSIEGGNLIDSLLPYSEKQKLLNGENEIVYNGLVIKKITRLEPKKAEVKAEPKKTVDVSKMSYQELLEYAKKNNIKAKTNKKADLIKAIEGNK